MAVTSATSIHCEVVPWDVEHHGEIYACWQQLLARLPELSIFHFPEWTALARLAGVVKPWRVLLIKRGREPLAIIPLKKRTWWTAEIIGEFSYENPPFLIDPAAEDEVWACLANWLRQYPGIRLLFLGRHCDEGRLQRLRQVMQQHATMVYLPRVMPMITIPLAASWEQYLAGLGHRTRANVRRLERQFAQEIPGAGFEVITESPAADEALIDLIAIYRRRWQQQVNGSTLDDPARAGYYQEALHWAVQQRLAAIPVVRINGKIVAALTLYHLPGQPGMQVHLFARERDVALPKHFSLGVLLCAKTIQWAIDRGIRQVGMSYGSSEYKNLLGGQEYPCWELYLARSSFERLFFFRCNCIIHYLRSLPVYLRYGLRRLAGGLLRKKGHAKPPIREHAVVG